MQTQNAASDLDVLLRLNDEYIDSVKTSNVKRFGEILADDFLCSLPDGTLIDRQRFLEQTSKPSALGSWATSPSCTLGRPSRCRMARRAPAAIPTCGRGGTASGWLCARTSRGNKPRHPSPEAAVAPASVS